MIKELSFVLTRFCRNQSSRLYLAVIVLTFLVLSTPAYSQVYAYADSYKNGDSVAGYSSVTGYYNSSTHVYTTNATLSSPTRSVSSSASGTSASLSISIQLEDGFYSLSSHFVGTCPNPQGGGNHAVGGSGDSTIVVPFVKLDTWGSWSKSNIGPSTSSDISVTFSWSENAVGSIQLDFGPTSVTGMSSANIAPSGSGNFAIPHATGSATASFTGSGLVAGSFKATVAISKVSGNFDVLPPPFLESSTAVNYTPGQ